MVVPGCGVVILQIDVRFQFFSRSQNVACGYLDDVCLFDELMKFSNMDE